MEADQLMRSVYQRAAREGALLAKEITEKHEAQFLQDLGKISMELATWARIRLKEGFTLQAVRDCLLIQQDRAKTVQRGSK